MISYGVGEGIHFCVMSWHKSEHCSWTLLIYFWQPSL